MGGTAKTSTKDCPSRFPVESPSLPAVDKSRLTARLNSSPVVRKAASERIPGTKRPPHWDFKTYGLLFLKDIEVAQKLKRENPAAFKSSARAQAIVAWSEQFHKWAVAIRRAGVQNIPQPFRDLQIARDRKRKPKERFAALERFARLFLKPPLRVVVQKIDPKTSNLVKVDRRGRKRSSATYERIRLAARRRNERISERKMATELFPGLTKDQAYARTRDFFFKNRYAIESMRYCLRRLYLTPPNFLR